ncbi:MAG: amidohydrolase family protein, partial [Chloroflexales bacterium]|nr:amidohydrolase family protein [Chloroflexales bacterium]
MAHTASESDSNACDLAVVGGTVLTEDAAGIIDDGFIAITAGKIAAVGTRADLEDAWKPARVVDAAGMIVLPGFIDAHQHLGPRGRPQPPYAAADGSGLLARPGAVENFAPIISRIGQMDVTPEAVYEGVSLFLRALTRVGFTGVVDAGGPQPEAVAAAA